MCEILTEGEIPGIVHRLTIDGSIIYDRVISEELTGEICFVQIGNHFIAAVEVCETEVVNSTCKVIDAQFAVIGWSELNEEDRISGNHMRDKIINTPSEIELIGSVVGTVESTEAPSLYRN